MENKIWRCPKCGRQKKWEYDLVLKVCSCCLEAMEVVEDGEVKEE